MTSIKTILRINAASCIGFGGLFVASPDAVASFLGTAPAPKAVILVLGALLMLNGAHLLYTSIGAHVPKPLVLYFSTGDVLWVLATVALVATGKWITTTPGIVAALAVAAAVGAMGLAQLAVVRRGARTAPPPRQA
jgi:hypothetical protein